MASVRILLWICLSLYIHIYTCNFIQTQRPKKVQSSNKSVRSIETKLAFLKQQTLSEIPLSWTVEHGSNSEPASYIVQTIETLVGQKRPVSKFTVASQQRTDRDILRNGCIVEGAKGRKVSSQRAGKCAESRVTIAGAVKGSHRTGKARPADLGHHDLVPKAALAGGYDPLNSRSIRPSIGWSVVDG